MDRDFERISKRRVYPGDDLLWRRGELATIVSAAALHDRVRDGNGWDDRAATTRIPPILTERRRHSGERGEIARARAC